MLDRSAYQPTQWTVATGRLIYPPYIWVDTPTWDVKNQESLKPLGRANHAHTWWYNRSPLNQPSAHTLRESLPINWFVPPSTGVLCIGGIVRSHFDGV